MRGLRCDDGVQLMGQNTSTAVMARRVEPHDSLDDYPTPPWAVRALCEHLDAYVRDQSVWEPACGRGHMARALGEYFGEVSTSDIASYGWSGQQRTVDFLWPGSEPEKPVDWIVTNPPFRLAEQFYLRALSIASFGVAMLVRTQFLEGIGRYRTIFGPNAPTTVLQFSERVPMIRGRYDPAASTATAYCWIIKEAFRGGCTLRWIAPCRERLVREGDAI